MTEAGEIVVERDLLVSARDGVLLATDVCWPEGPGPFPVLLERTQYDKSAASDPSATPLQKPTHLAPRRVRGSDHLDVLNAAVVTNPVLAPFFSSSALATTVVACDSSDTAASGTSYRASASRSRSRSSGAGVEGSASEATMPMEKPYIPASAPRAPEQGTPNWSKTPPVKAEGCVDDPG
jgi:hypothetical protein